MVRVTQKRQRDSISKLNDEKEHKVTPTIKAKNPDLIMSAVFIETPHLLYVKDGLIFVYNHEKDVSTELNEYVRKRYKRVSLLNVVRIPYIYAKLIGELTTTGHTPKDRINLCP